MEGDGSSWSRGISTSPQKGCSFSSLISLQLNFDSVKTSGNLHMKAFGCSKRGSWLQSRDAVLGWEEEYEISVDSMCRTMGMDVRWLSSRESGSLDSSLHIKNIVTTEVFRGVFLLIWLGTVLVSTPEAL